MQDFKLKLKMDVLLRNFLVSYLGPVGALRPTSGAGPQPLLVVFQLQRPDLA